MRYFEVEQVSIVRVVMTTDYLVPEQRRIELSTGCMPLEDSTEKTSVLANLRDGKEEKGLLVSL